MISKQTMEQIVPGIDVVVAVAAGMSHSLLLRKDGSVWATGKNDHGQLGDGTMISKKVFVKVVSSGIQAVAAGAWHSMAMNEHGDVWSAGANDSGQLGDGSYVLKNKFVKVTPASGGAWFTVLLLSRIRNITRTLTSFFS